MTICKICGSRNEARDGLAFCPSCLLTDALEDMMSPERTPMPNLAPAAIAGLPSGLGLRLERRLDFFDKYQILRRVGGGGQGEVWEVWDYQFRRTLAMKRLSPDLMGSPAACYRFVAEAQLASQLRHPGILPIYDMGLDPDGKPFYTTELLAGSTFVEVWQAVKESDPDWPLRKALELLVRVAEIMAHAHSRGIIHRDLKPSNIMVGRFGDVRVIDWGSARVLSKSRPEMEEPFVHIASDQVQTDRDDSMRPDLPTSVAGQPITPSFMPPEILTGHFDQLGPETDVYSMGVLLYELLTHRLPFADSGGILPKREALLEFIKTSSPADVRHINPKVSRDLAAITEKAMAREKSSRYRSMNDLAEDLRAALEIRPVSARKRTVWLRLQKLAQRHPAYILLGCLMLGIVAVALSVVRSLEVKTATARQVTALRNAELAARNGHWRDDLHFLAESEEAGYNDRIYLGLQRAEAWTVLNAPDKSAAELNRLMRRSDLGSRRGAVLLRMGDHELFDKATVEQGEEHIGQALKAGVPPADELVARGLLAVSVPQALDFFHQALRIDPYAYSAHIHSLGLELVLGHHAELAAHCGVFLILYPDDPSPRYLQAMEFASAGRPDDAIAVLQPLRASMAVDSWDKLVSGYRKIAEADSAFGINQVAGTNLLDASKFNKLMLDAGALLAAGVADSHGGLPRLREPHLPCLEHGLLDAVPAVQAIGVPFYKDITPFVRQIKTSWKICPEGTLPFRAATFIEFRQPRTGAKSLSLLQVQAELYQMAADSSSFVPQLPRSARYLATQAELKLINSHATNESNLRAICLQNLQAAASAEDISPPECRSYSQAAASLGNFDCARQLIDRWEAIAPNDSEVEQSRIELQLAAEDYVGAIRLIDKQLARDSGNTWALTERRVALAKLADSFISIDPHTTK